jgi:general L-amino acid transport system substrate-binding protein
MINAEELGVTSDNIDEMKSSTNPEIRRLLGLEGGKGQGLQIADEWAYNIVKQVGNYGEIFERNLGKDTPLTIERGLNALWNNGGIQYAPPFR